MREDSGDRDNPHLQTVQLKFVYGWVFYKSCVPFRFLPPLPRQHMALLVSVDKISMRRNAQDKDGLRWILKSKRQFFFIWTILYQPDLRIILRALVVGSGSPPTMPRFRFSRGIDSRLVLEKKNNQLKREPAGITNSKNCSNGTVASRPCRKL